MTTGLFFQIISFIKVTKYTQLTHIAKLNGLR